MRNVAVAILQREDLRILIGQRRKDDTSPLKWEFPGGKVNEGETPEAALAREIREELGVQLTKSAEIGTARHRYAKTGEEWLIRFFVAQAATHEVKPMVFEQVKWVLPKELGSYDFLAANEQVVAQLATGRIKPLEILEATPAAEKKTERPDSAAP